MLAKWFQLLGKSEDEAYDYLAPGNVNSKESLAPMFISKILKNNENKQYTVSEIKEILSNSPYKLEMGIKAVRRTLLTMAVNSNDIWCQHGEKHNKELYFWYSKEKPEDSITIDDLGEIYFDENQ